MLDRIDSISRRRLLGTVCGTAALGLAGCTKEIGEEFPPNRKSPVAEFVPTLPVKEQKEVVAEGIEEMADAEIRDEEEFANTFEDYALEVDSVDRTAEVLTIEYINTKLYEEGNLHDIGPIAGAYAALIEGGYDSQILGITILDAAPASFGSATIDTKWVERYHKGEYSSKEFGEMVIETIQSKRHPPEVGVSPDT